MINVHDGDIIPIENQVWYDCWIDNMVTGEHIILPQTPMNWGENYSANYAQQEIIGSSRPRMMYTGTSLRTMSFSLQNLHRSYLPNGYNSLTDYIHKLQALCFPKYSKSGIITAPDCHLQMGERGFQGVFTAVNVTWGDEVYNRSNKYTLGSDLLPVGLNQNRVSSGQSRKINGGERIRANVELSFTNTRIKGDIPGATLISTEG